MKKNFITGFITGGIICAAVTGFAVEYAVTTNPYPVKVNGVETAIEGYNINDSTYFKLRDVADAVGGFEVGFEDNAIVVNTPNVLYDNRMYCKLHFDILVSFQLKANPLQVYQFFLHNHSTRFGIHQRICTFR